MPSYYTFQIDSTCFFFQLIKLQLYVYIAKFKMFTVSPRWIKINRWAKNMRAIIFNTLMRQRFFFTTNVGLARNMIVQTMCAANNNTNSTP